MTIFLSLLGMVGSILIMKYRARIADNFGQASWMNSIGGKEGFLVLVAIFIFFWSIASLTGTTDVLFAPLRWILPFGRQPEPEFF